MRSRAWFEMRPLRAMASGLRCWGSVRRLSLSAARPEASVVVPWPLLQPVMNVEEVGELEATLQGATLEERNSSAINLLERKRRAFSCECEAVCVCMVMIVAYIC